MALLILHRVKERKSLSLSNWATVTLLFLKVASSGKSLIVQCEPRALTPELTWAPSGGGGGPTGVIGCYKSIELIQHPHSTIQTTPRSSM